MNPARWQQLKVAFDAALPLDLERRREYIERHCASDPELRREIESMLASHDEMNEAFLSTPAVTLEGFEALTDPVTAQDPWVGKHIGAYRLVRQLGSGGMGEVYLAVRADAEFDQQVAIKLIRGGQESAAIIARFRAERQILAGLEHPYIARLLDGGRTPDGQPYFVMEYVPGLPVNEYCDRHRLGVRERLELFIEVCDGVQYAHQNAIIHRDLKPTHVLIVEVDGMAVPRIIDFGVAKTMTSLSEASHLTQFGTVMGTPDYMSPEQLDPRIKIVDTRSDVYSLGLILYLLLVGSLPFEQADSGDLPLEKLLRRVREEEPPAPSSKLGADPDAAKVIASTRGLGLKELRKQLRGDLDSILLKALQRDRERRYASARELAEDIGRHLNSEPVMARPASTAYRTRKFIRRHRIGTAFIAMAILLGAIASGAGLVAIQQKRAAQRAQHEAELQAEQALKAQARLLTQAAAQRLKDGDVAGAQGIILAVLTDPRFGQAHAADAQSVFQEVRAADAQLAVLSGHRDMVIAAAYSPDDTRIVTGSADRSARIWDAQTGLLLATLAGHRDHVGSVAFSPDGLRIVTASNDRTARLWDARSGAPVALLAGHGDMVNSAAFSPDGGRIITGSSDKTVRVWDARSGAPLAVLARFDAEIYSVAYSPDGTRIVAACDDKTARILDARSGARLVTLTGHGDRVNAAAFSPDGKQVVTASLDKTARIWDARSGKEIKVLSGHGDAVFAAAYSRDGEHIVTASGDKTARIWDARSGEMLQVLSGHAERLLGAAYSQDGTRIVTASRDQTARIWRASPAAQLAVLSGHDSYVNSAAYSPDGARIVTASRDKTARIWDARNGSELPVRSTQPGYLDFAAFSPDGARIVTASSDKSARIVDSHSGAQIALLAGHEGIIYSALYSPDGDRIVSGGDDKTARIWDAKSGTPIKVLTGHTGYVFSAAYSPDGMRIVTASGDGSARVWDARTGAQLAVLSGHSGPVYSAVYSPDGIRILTVSGDRTARIWDTHTDESQAVLVGHRGSILGADYSPDGGHVVTASGDGTARIWDAQTGEQLAVLAGHADAVLTAVYAPDGARIVTASSDKTARIWDASIPAGLSAQILWAAAAQVDPLPDADRQQLGLPGEPHPRVWAAAGSECSRVVAALYDQDHVTPDESLKSAPAHVAKDGCEPSALIRLAELDDAQARTEYEGARHALWLRAFTAYAAAAERAREEAWPDEKWVAWRHRRATLARLLADAGMMQEVADAYGTILGPR